MKKNIIHTIKIMSYDDIMDYLKRNLYSENDIHINERSKFRVYSGDFNIEDINAKTDQIFKIYNNPLCFKFLNFMYKLYIGCKASEKDDTFLPFQNVQRYWNSKFTVNQEYFQFLLKDIFLVIRNHGVYITPMRSGKQGRLSTGSMKRLK